MIRSRRCLPGRNKRAIRWKCQSRLGLWKLRDLANLTRIHLLTGRRWPELSRNSDTPEGGDENRRAERSRRRVDPRDQEARPWFMNCRRTAHAFDNPAATAPTRGGQGGTTGDCSSWSQPGSLIATGTADGSGVWSATVLNQPMADGTYIVTGEVMNSSGTVLATASLGTVVVDTVGPVVDSVTFNRKTATAVITYQDSLSGLDIGSISKLAFYHLSAKPLSKPVREPRLILPESDSVAPGSSPTSPEVVTVVFPHTRKGLSAGRYLLKIDSGESGNGVEDAAGNPLDGHYSGKFPSGDGVSGGDFVAEIRAPGNKVRPLAPGKRGQVEARPRAARPHAHR
jgi:hypothetical protein